MARPELTEMDRYYIETARKVLAASRALDMSDDRQVGKMLGRLEVVAAGLLYILDDGSVAADDGAVA